jgi:hypothetical protein
LTAIAQKKMFFNYFMDKYILDRERQARIETQQNNGKSAEDMNYRLQDEVMNAKKLLKNTDSPHGFQSLHRPRWSWTMTVNQAGHPRAVEAAIYQMRMGVFRTAVTLATANQGSVLDPFASNECPFCWANEPEDLEHLILKCPKWENERAKTIDLLAGHAKVELSDPEKVEALLGLREWPYRKSWKSAFRWRKTPALIKRALRHDPEYFEGDNILDPTAPDESSESQINENHPPGTGEESEIQVDQPGMDVNWQAAMGKDSETLEFGVPPPKRVRYQLERLPLMLYLDKVLLKRLHILKPLLFKNRKTYHETQQYIDVSQSHSLVGQASVPNSLHSKGIG